MEERILGRYEGATKGPLIICLGGMHGNEPAGIAAIQEIFRLLYAEPIVNPGFQYHGRILGIQGNLAALASGRRFIDQDLNRILIPDDIRLSRNIDPSHWNAEERERDELDALIEQEISDYQPELTLLLDLHTTTADGGIFTIAATDSTSRSLAVGLHAPVILGIAEGLSGTTISYFNNPPENRYCLVFEAGQHEDPQSIHRTVAAIVNCMRSLGSVQPHDVDHRHDGILIDMSVGLPKMTKLKFHYRIAPGEHFVMHQGFQNFQQVKAGDPLATNDAGIITSPVDGLILMPKYQLQGNDGFFIVEAVDSSLHDIAGAFNKQGA